MQIDNVVLLDKQGSQPRLLGTAATLYLCHRRAHIGERDVA
jgi:hypothetical protein